MGIFNHFPWSDEHQLNLDWILRSLKDLLIRVKALEDSGGGGGGGGTTDYLDLDNKPQINSVTLTGNKTAAQLGLKAATDSDVFWATIGTTTYTQITNAVNDNKLVCAKKSLASGKSRIYYCLGKPFDSNYFLFVATTPTTIYSYRVDAEDWTEQLNVDVLKLATTLPVMDGVATAGVLLRAAKADHVHPTDTSRASAADVGDLSELNTTAKSSIVAAVNETLAAGSPTAQQIQDAVDDYLDDHPALTGMFTNAAKSALISLLEKVAYVDGNGQQYLDVLIANLEATVTSISAVFTQGQTIVYNTDSLDSLKSMLVVTATYSDSSTVIVPSADYTLSGTLTVGTSTITVSYAGATDTFTVVVTQSTPLYSLYNHTFNNDAAVITSAFLSSDTDITIAFDVDFGGQLSNETWKLFGMSQSASPWRGLVVQSWRSNSNDMMIQNMANQIQLGTINFRSYTGNFKYIVTHALGSGKWHYYYKIGTSAVVDAEVTSPYEQITNAMTIGGNVAGTQYFKGTVNKAEVWSRVLTSSEINTFMG